MQAKIDFYQGFARRMFLLALITGLIVSISMPLTYLVLSLREQGARAQTQSEQLAWRLNTQSSGYWPAGVQDYAEQQADLTGIRLYDKNGILLYQAAIKRPSVLDTSGRAAIIENKSIVGYIEVTRRPKVLLYSTLLLLLASSALGTLFGNLLYRFPTGIVRRAQGEIKEAFYKLNHLSYHDALTNLPNRIQLNERLTLSLQQAGRRRMKVAVIFLDLDDFKNINDTLGHSYGDLLLRQVAKRLLSCIRECDTVARLGGDEFIIMLPDIYEALDAARVAQRVVESLAQPFTLDGHELVVTASIGISVYPADGQNLETLVRNADTAMYRAKSQGKNKYQFYTRTMNAKAMERLTMENGLRKAIKQEELEVYYQPIIDLYSGDIIGMEALVRWRHPEMGLVMPDKFIPLAEETGLIVPLGEWILRSACTQTKAWQLAGMLPMYISVNISSRQFMHRGLVDTVISILAETGLEPQYLQLEVTESIAAYDEERVSTKLQALRNLGIRIAIDDFGTGYSSLGSLKKFPFNTLKIDKSFIHNITVDPYDAVITNTIIAMANSLNLSVVAEGVEDEGQLAFLMERGCSAMQGYLFCSPQSRVEIEKTLLQRKMQKLGRLEAAATMQ